MTDATGMIGNGGGDGEDLVVGLRDVSFTYALGDGGDGMPLPAPTPALRRVSLDVRAGEVVVLCGRSGCGKTTVTRLLNGLIPGFFRGWLEGPGTVCGLDVHASPIEAFVPLVGSVFQNPKTQYFNAVSTDELAFPCENLGWEPDRIRSRVADVAVRLGVGGLLGRNVLSLSGGQRQRLAVAAAMMPGPRLVVMDEPTGNLDAAAMRGLHDLVARLKADGVAVVIAEHRLAWCADLADRYVLFEDGAVSGEWTGAQFAALPKERRESWGLRALDLTLCREALRRRMGADASSVADAVAARQMATSPRIDDGESHTRMGTADGVGPDRSPSASDDESHTRMGTAAHGGGGTPIVSTHGLVVGHRRWPGRPTFTRAVPDLNLRAGRITGLMGPNGAGKTTLVRTLCGLAKPLAGQVLLRGRRATRTALTDAGFLVMQDVNYQLFADGVREELLMGKGKAGDVLRTGAAVPDAAPRESVVMDVSAPGAAPRDAASSDTGAPRVDAGSLHPRTLGGLADSILAELGLLELADRHPMSLSGGQKQRLAVATAVMCGKELIVLDEPTSGLDLHHMMRVGALLRSLADRGRAVLVVTHDEELAAHWCDDVISLE